jgi:excisionase family DNA binding protein
VTAPEHEIKSVGQRLASFDRALTAYEVAALLKVHLDTVYKQARAGNLPSFRIGTSIRFDPKKLGEWYESIG